MKTTRVTVTALKAPWPEGTQIGSIVAFKGEPPAWALGKFVEAPEGAKTDFTYEPQEVAVGNGTGAALPSIDAINAQVADLQEQLATAEAAKDALLKDKEASESEMKGLREKLATAEAALVTAQKAAKK